MKVLTAPKAKADIALIGNWIAEENPRKAISFMEDLQKACDKIGDMPRGYVVVQRYRDHEVRRKPFYGYLIFYRIKNGAVEILHVVNGAWDYSNLL